MRYLSGMDESGIARDVLILIVDTDHRRREELGHELLRAARHEPLIAATTSEVAAVLAGLELRGSRPRAVLLSNDLPLQVRDDVTALVRRGAAAPGVLLVTFGAGARRPDRLDAHVVPTEDAREVAARLVELLMMQPDGVH